MEQNLKTKLINRKIEKPDPFLMSLSMGILGLLNKAYKVNFSYDYDPKALEGKPVILLSSHASRLEFIYTLYGFKRKDVNMVCGFQNILDRSLYHLFIKLGVISKYLYQPDIMCVKHMLGVLKRNGAIGLFPEGIQSTSGSTHPINPATASFIKRSKANIVVCTSKGAYLATNRYCADRKKGYIGIEYSLTFTPEQLEEFSEEEINRILLEKISYNDFAYNKVARHRYTGKKPNACGLQKILYKCPDCGTEHTLRVEKDTVVCDSCGFKVQVNEYYDLVPVSGKGCPNDIDAWYKWQRRCVAREITDDAFRLSLSGTLCTLRLDKLAKPPKNRKVLSVGVAQLTNRGLTFTGSLDGAQVNYDFPALSVYSMTFSSKGYLEFYHHNDYYMLIPDDASRCVIKWTLAAEEIHNLYDQKWQEACAAAYGKEEIYESV